MALSLSRYANKQMLITRDALDALLAASILDDHIPEKPASGLHTQNLFSTTSAAGVLLTNNLTELDADSEVVYYHPIEGVILADQEWDWDWTRGWHPMFSTRAFIKNLQEAERSQNVVAHFLHTNSGGGEAWLLPKAVEAMRACKKPIYAFIEQYCCSAAYYLACNAQVIKAYTEHDTIGSIGCMVRTMNFAGYFEALGIKEIEEYATRSDLKNKKVNDLLAGEPGQYIKEVLDPQQAVFEATVRSARSQLDNLSADHPVFRGETFFSDDAIECGLIDGLAPDLATAINEAYELGVSVKNNNNLLSNL